MNDDLQWLAFQYIADELSDEERNAFEARLANDQEVREAVARAVELSTAIRLSAPVARLRESRKPGWAAWLAGGVVSACLALTALFTAKYFFPAAEPDLHVDNAEVDIQLAHAWSEVRELPFDELFPDESAARELADVDSLSLPAIPELNAAPPAWMVVALSDLAQEKE